MTTSKTITISLPIAMGKEIVQVARAEHRTVSELLREAFRQYRASRNLKSLARAGRSAARVRHLRQEDFES